ncbi:MAG: carboxypeptidase-like regulatory domain-containing protein, partial [Ferruginibacter sp.]|nr:carboxypeptidase-like regulatory domain-containing protein [Chitinophagaceae bacterium]
DTANVPVNEPLLTIKGEIQTKVATAPVCSTEIMGDVMAEPQKIIVEKLHIKGKVISETGAPVPFATIAIKGTNIGVAADANGEFSILPGTNWEKIILVSSCVGFESTEIVVDRKTYTKGLVVNIVSVKLNYELMGAVIITKCYSQKINKPVPVIPDLQPLTKAFFVYPNPALAGNNVTIEWKEKAEGYYTVRFLNLAGQAIHQQEAWIDAEARSLTIDVPATTPGSYFLVLANKKTGKKFTEKLIIQ